MAKSSLLDYWIEVISIIEGGLKPDPQRVATYAKHLAGRLEDNGESKLAQRILTITNHAMLPAGSIYKAGTMLADVEAQMNLVEEKLPNEISPYPILPEDVEIELRRFVTLRKRIVDLERKNITPPATLLLCGPPGCGKTMAAHAIAHDLKLPLLTVRLESVMASFLGSSAKNLRRLFDGAQARPSILFLDEFDAIGKMRDDPQEIGEIKRLVNSLLQNLDRVSGQLMVIAATNHPQLLDEALWRRFDVVLRFSIPDAEQIGKIIIRGLRETSLSESVIGSLSILAQGLSGASIISAVNRATQNSVILDGKPLERLLTREIIRQKIGENEKLPSEDDVRSLADAILKHVDSKLSLTETAKLLRCTPQNIYRIRKSQRLLLSEEVK